MVSSALAKTQQQFLQALVKLPLHNEKKGEHGVQRMLISGWLNTSKDPIVGNEQRCGAFWQRISNYFGSCQDSEAREPASAIQCKQRWQKINDLKKFTLEHAWKELKNDQKWCDFSSSKNAGYSKRKRLDDGNGIEEMEATKTCEEDNGNSRPIGVKAAKAKGKNSIEELKVPLAEFQTMWTIKERDNAHQEKMSKLVILQCLLGKKETLTEYEEDFKKNLISEMM
ncbi:hypothetical protein EUTSA_v10019661mg [Eutrema salsugineum]|uniref:Uncharacterized protein n=1 Tax=Eutrema salsugineum TaxID=72664 RepID=V4M8X6_EUTSA|nr:glutathione S-transferase T3 [Eutrema salsugineum]ESQ27591.1 hypothetical protein EUTSA_v10019661mg [Eutrema salsugineum]